MAEHFRLAMEGRSGRARAATFHTPHGPVRTPAFMVVGTNAAVRGLSPEQVRSAGTQVVLANTYHLALRPGEALVAKLGGLHAFMRWDGPILTDSGGFQVFSLPEKKKRISDEGVVFRNEVDGKEMNLTPERSIEIQEQLGADVIMALDECTPYPASEAQAGEGVARTLVCTLRRAGRFRLIGPIHRGAGRAETGHGIRQLVQRAGFALPIRLQQLQLRLVTQRAGRIGILEQRQARLRTAQIAAAGKGQRDRYPVLILLLAVQLGRVNAACPRREHNPGHQQAQDEAGHQAGDQKQGRLAFSFLAAAALGQRAALAAGILASNRGWGLAPDRDPNPAARCAGR